MLGWIALALFVVGLLYFRLAPIDVARWHTPIVATSNEDRAGGAIRVIDADQDTFTQLDSVLRQLPRTTVLAGSLEDGRITYVTRSLIFGFPDFTTIEHDRSRIKLHARLRFGKSDMGVNRRRLERALAEVAQR